MLEQFTWQQFMICITGTSAIYYAALGLLYYREEINAVFHRRRSVLESTYRHEIEDEALLGSPAKDEGFTVSSMEDLRFPNDKVSADDQQVLLGQISDLLEEFKTLISITAETGESKEDFLSLFRFTIAKYPAAKRSNIREAINTYVLESSEGNLSFSLTEEDLIQCWNQAVDTPHSSVVPLTFSLLLMLLAHNVYAQDGNAGINEATNKVKSYFDTGTDLMYAVGAVVGLIGAIKVYQKWNAGEPDTGKVASAWFGSCIFLVVVATVLKSFFGI